MSIEHSQSAGGTIAEATPPLLDVENLRVAFPGAGARFGFRVPAREVVRGISLFVRVSEAVALVGESGCGKTTAARAVLGLTAPRSGRIDFDGRTLFNDDGQSTGWTKSVRRAMQIVFQDAGGALNPRLRVGDLVAEPLIVHGLPAEHTDSSPRVRARSGDRPRRRAQVRAEALRLLDICGLPAHTTDRWPHQLSGGQRQRIVIARAMATRPKLLVCDEPTSALDVSIQAQIINLLMDLKREFGLSLLLISHDLGVVSHVADRVCVMKDGAFVETGWATDVFANPRHPYTAALLRAAAPSPESERDIPSPRAIGVVGANNPA